MKVSTKVECGIMILIDICVSSGGESVTVANIAARQNLSAKYLEQIVPLLKSARIIRSVKGARGGYYLAKPAKEITMQQVLDALDPSVLSCAEFESISESDISRSISDCVWALMSQSLRQIAAGITLAELAAYYKHMAEEHAAHLMYYI